MVYNSRRKQVKELSDVLEGYVEKIVFRNPENGYTVLTLTSDGNETTCVGMFTFINEGEFISATGT
ncbi:MAG: hypothetical protein ACK5JH_11310, partial [Anaerocolumna sp.]